MQAPNARHLRFHASLNHLASPFGNDRFGLLAESFARTFGTPKFIIIQTLIVLAWIAVNAAVIALRWDPYPFILLNLAFSTQAAYAAPLILLAQTRQADRDKAWSNADAQHRQELSDSMMELLRENTELTRQVEALTMQVHSLTKEIHAKIAPESAS